MLTDLLIITLAVMAGFPLIIAAVSFAFWQNCFRMLGAGYIVRMTIVLIAITWVIYFIPGGVK